MLDERAYKVEFLGSDKPETVMINGFEASADAWSYDEKGRVLTVNVPTTSCDVTTSIEVKYGVMLQNNLTDIDNAESATAAIRYDAQSGTVTAQLSNTAVNARLEVVSANGAETCTASGNNCDSLAADISSFRHGTYICRLTADGKTVTCKIVK